MTNKINIAQLLKGVPKGTKIYSPLFGKGTILEVSPQAIIVKRDDMYWEKPWTFDKYGHVADIKCDRDTDECLLFPSEQNKDWSTYKKPWKHKHFKPYQKVLVRKKPGCWEPFFYGYFDFDQNTHKIIDTALYGFNDDEIIPYKGNEDKIGKRID